jgi:hypothetical protein
VILLEEKKLFTCEHEVKNTIDFTIFDDYKKLISSVLDKSKGEEITRVILQEGEKSHIKQYYNHVTHRQDIDFLKNKRLLYLLGSLLLINILANIVLYSNFAIWVDNDIIFEEENMFFRVLIIVISLTFITFYLIFYALKNQAILKIVKYIGTVQIISFAGIMTGIFWAALFSWSAFAAYILVNIDLSYIKPDKEKQLGKNQVVE